MGGWWPKDRIRFSEGRCRTRSGSSWRFAILRPSPGLADHGRWFGARASNSTAATARHAGSASRPAGALGPRAGRQLFAWVRSVVVGPTSPRRHPNHMEGTVTRASRGGPKSVTRSVTRLRLRHKRPQRGAERYTGVTQKTEKRPHRGVVALAPIAPVVAQP